MKNYEDLALRDLHNSSQDTQPHPSNLVSRIIKITHAHNLHVKMLDFVSFTIRK